MLVFSFIHETTWKKGSVPAPTSVGRIICLEQIIQRILLLLNILLMNGFKASIASPDVPDFFLNCYQQAVKSVLLCPTAGFSRMRRIDKISSRRSKPLQVHCVSTCHGSKAFAWRWNTSDRVLSQMLITVLRSMCGLHSTLANSDTLECLVWSLHPSALRDVCGHI